MSIEARIARLVRPEIRQLKAYSVADASDLIKLDAMENPYGWPEPLKREWAERLTAVELNRYPDAAARKLTAQLHGYMAVPPGMELLLGNGSDELIQMILLAMAQPGAVVMAPTPGFVMYEMTARFVGMKFVGVPLQADNFDIDLPRFLQAVKENNPAVIFLAYPNNPTGNLFQRAALDEILATTSGLVVVDEAYHPFAGRSYMSELERHEDLLVMRTVSKLGLAGLRLGMLAGDRRWLGEFNKVRLPYNINSLTQVSAGFVLAHDEFLQQQSEQIIAERHRLYSGLQQLPAIQVWPSSANFILFRTRSCDATTVFEGLKQAGILIKNLHGSHPLLDNCLRVTVGQPRENDAFLTALSRLL